MIKNRLILFVFFYAVDVHSHHRHILHRHILHVQNQVDLRTVTTGGKYKSQLLNYIQGKKHSAKYKHGAFDIYNPVARFVNDNYDNSIGDISNLNLPRQQNAVKNAELSTTPASPIVNLINRIHSAANNRLNLLPNENHRELQTLENNPKNLPVELIQANTADRHIHSDSPSAATVGPVQSNINNNANYVIININGKPALVRVVNLPSIDMSNNIQTLPRVTTPIQGNNDLDIILLRASNVLIKDVDNIKAIPERASNINKDEPNNQDNGENNQVNESKEQIRTNPGSKGNKQRVMMQPEFAISTFDSETFDIDPR